MNRILVADDEEAIRLSLRRMLEGAGYKVVEAFDGAEGIRLYREAPVDLIVTDVLMPGKDGLELIKELKREFPDIKIIAISGYEHYLEMATLIGALHGMQKPVNTQEMLDTVQDLLEGSEGT